MNYADARILVLSYGWKPFRSQCGGAASPATCARYPELRYCQLTGQGLCTMTFAKPDRCLILTTAESPPGQGYTAVTDVFFREGSCPEEADQVS
jgi:hypothetical protein